MRIAQADELQVNALPVLAAEISESELSNWFPFKLHRLTHPQEVPEPSKAALIRLDTGDYFVLFWGEISNQMILRIPEATNASKFLSAFFKEVPLPRGRILWRRSDARLPRQVAANDVSAPRRVKRLGTTSAKTRTKSVKK
jgi:hypothetical protein